MFTTLSGRSDDTVNRHLPTPAPSRPVMFVSPGLIKRNRLVWVISVERLKIGTLYSYCPDPSEVAARTVSCIALSRPSAARTKARGTICKSVSISRRAYRCPAAGGTRSRCTATAARRRSTAEAAGPCARSKAGTGWPALGHAGCGSCTGTRAPCDARARIRDNNARAAGGRGCPPSKTGYTVTGASRRRVSSLERSPAA